MNMDQRAEKLQAGERQGDGLMNAPFQLPLALRYDGDERRRPGAQFPGPERRVPDPSTEQDHPELHEPEPVELQ